ncbi:MAG TPA: hypothetical protein VG937_24045 [Polyangiaceae bacterium]|nr:hypothetical protein [Polyangiaceae bacterium]
MRDLLVAVFMTAVVVVGIAGAVLSRKGSFDTKRRWHPRLVVGGGLVFVGFSLSVMPFAPVRLLVIPVVALFAWLNLRFTKFCAACGATQYNRTPWSPMRFCSKCGGPLDPVD